MLSSWRRRNYFIKRDLQGRCLFAAFAFAVTVLVAFAALLALSQTRQYTVSYQDFQLRVAPAPEALLQQVVAGQWAYILLAGLGVAAAALFLSHRVAGPLYRFERSLEQLIAGDLKSRLVLRDRDEGKEVAELLNRLGGALGAQVQGLDEALGEARRAVEVARRAPDPADREAALAGADAALESAAAILARYRMPPRG
ncbi:MAG: hypothetical protein ACYDA8_17015 [Deferrisomatales bacterium]